MKNGFGATAALAVSLLVAGICLPGMARCADAIPRKSDIALFNAGRHKATLPNGEVLSYVTVGESTGRPVVFLHGFTDNAGDWIPLFSYLSKDFYLILVDMRGHGQSSAPECCYSRYDFAYDVKLLLDELHIDRADVV